MTASTLFYSVLRGEAENPFPELTGKLFQKIDDAVAAALEFHRAHPPTEEVLGTRSAIAEVARDFHAAAGTLTTDVAEALKALTDPASVVIENAHQPNIFPHDGMVRKFALQRGLHDRIRAQGHRVVSLFGVVDQTHANAKFFRSARLPDIFAKEGALDIRANVSKRTQKSMDAVEIPSPDCLRRWRDSFQTSRRMNIKALNELFRHLTGNVAYDRSKRMAESERMDKTFLMADGAAGRARSLAQFNAFFLSRLVNWEWEFPVLFHEYSRSQVHFGRVHRKALAWAEEYAREAQRIYDEVTARGIALNFSRPEDGLAPFWVMCGCGGMVSARFSHGALSVEACPECHRAAFAMSEPDWSAVSPRAIYRPILVSEALRPAIFVTGTGGSIGFHLISRGFARRRAIPLHPFVAWAGATRRWGVAKTLAAAIIETGRAPKGMDPVKATAKARLALAVSPSIIESLVEVGIPETWRYWTQVLGDTDLVRNRELYVIPARDPSFPSFPDNT